MWVLFSAESFCPFNTFGGQLLTFVHDWCGENFSLPAIPAIWFLQHRKHEHRKVGANVLCFPLPELLTRRPVCCAQEAVKQL